MRRYPKLLVITSLLFVLGAGVFGQAQNPFLSDEAEEGEAETSFRMTLHYPAFMQSFIRRVSAMQRTLNRRMTELGHDIAEGRRRDALLVLAMISLVYSIVHALDPGHGKTVSFSYCLTERRSVLRGVLFGVFVAFAQILVAIVLVFVLYYLLKMAFFASFETFRSTIRLVSAGLISGLGVWLFLGSVGVIPAFHRHFSSEDEEKTLRTLLPAALSIGMIPCPGAVIIMLFTLNMGMVSIGVLLALVFGLGMSLTISSVGVATVSAKNFLSRKLATRKIARHFHTWTGRVGSLLLFSVGVIIILSAG
jgi:ABC-type nickel/cobalt efflux system permease component RcnA